MPFPTRHQPALTIVLSLLAQYPTSGSAQQHSSTPQDGSYGEYSPPMTTVLVVVVGLFLAAGLVSVYFRHFALCLGFDYGGARGGDGGGAWRRREAARGGLDSSVVESFPTFLYSDVKVHRIGKATLECAVCLSEFLDDETLQMLPVCSHVFHPDCITPWLASHVTCPVCRANLEFQHRRQHFETLLQHLNQLSDDELEPSDQIHQTNHHHHDELEPSVLSVGPSPNNATPIKSPVHEIKDGGGRRGKLPRSHSTGHSLAGDCERFTLRLPDEVRNKLVNANQSILPAMISPRIGYRARSVGCTGFPVKPDRWRFSASPPFISRPGSTGPPTPKTDIGTESSNNNLAGIMSGPKNLLKAIKSPLNRGVRYTSDIGERSSDKLWPNRRPQDLESDGQ